MSTSGSSDILFLILLSVAMESTQLKSLRKTELASIHIPPQAYSNFILKISALSCTILSSALAIISSISSGLMYSCVFFEVRNLISHPLLAANRYLFLMLSWVKAGALSKPCYQYTQRILGKVLTCWLMLMQKRRRMGIALMQLSMLVDTIDCIVLQFGMLDEGTEIRKVILSNFKQQLPLFEEMAKKLQRLPELTSEDPELVSEYASVETSLSKWRTLSNENQQLIKKYANYDDAVTNIDTYEKLQIAISTQQFIEESLESMAKSKWPAQIYNDFAEWAALQKYNIIPLLGP